MYSQIREMRPKISLQCIKNNKIVTEKGINESKVEQMCKQTSKLFDSLLEELKKNCDLRVIKLCKLDSVDKTLLKKDSRTKGGIVNQFIILLCLAEIAIKQEMKACQEKVELVNQYVSLVSMLIEMDKHYTQKIADKLVLLNEKSSQVKEKLSEKV